MKAEEMNISDIKAAIMMTETPKDMKYLGDGITMDVPQKNVWDEKKKKVMKVGLDAKYNQNPNLKTMLLETVGARISEASYDKYWGVCKKLTDPEALNPGKWSGKNTMGKLLETIRDELLQNK